MPRPREFDDTAAIEAAMQAFWTKGYEATSTEDLCRRTGLGRGSLYNAFGSKQALYEHAVRHYTEIGFHANLAVLEQPGPVRERLRAFMMSAVDTDDPDNRGCLVVNAAVEAAGRSDAVSELVRRQVTRLETVICGMLTVAQRAGEVSRHLDPLRTARTLLSVHNGLRVLGRTVTDRRFLTDVVEGALASL